MLVRSWVRKIPLEKGMATHSSVLPGKFHGQRSMAARLQSMGPQSQTRLSTHTTQYETEQCETAF